MASLSRELAEAKQEVVTLKALIQQNELAMAKQEQASSELSLKLAQAEDTIDGLKSELATKSLILKDLEGLSRPSGESFVLTEVEKRVRSQIRDTQLQISHVSISLFVNNMF
jgi:chromosome segregation ATPase